MRTETERREQNTARKRKYRKENRVLIAERQRAWAAANPDKVISSYYKTNYGITKDQFDEMLASQNGACAICGTKEPQGSSRTFHVDHCHKTQRVRGLLCHHCNVGLGHFFDIPAALRSAATYIEGSNGHVLH